MQDELLIPWGHCPQDIAAAAEAELLREVPPGHPLRGVRVRALAQRRDCDDVLFEIAASPAGRFAVVHLTWSGREDQHASFPSTTFYDSLDTWRRDCMIPDHEDWID